MRIPKGQKHLVLRFWFIIFLWGFEPLCTGHFGTMQWEFGDIMYLIWNFSGLKNASGQSWKTEKNARFSTKTDVFFSIVQIWRLVFLEPMGVQRLTVPHLKGLIKLYLEPLRWRAWRYFFFAPRPLEKSHFTPKNCDCPDTIYSSQCMVIKGMEF